VCSCEEDLTCAGPRTLLTLTQCCMTCSLLRGIAIGLFVQTAIFHLLLCLWLLLLWRHGLRFTCLIKTATKQYPYKHLYNKVLHAGRVHMAWSRTRITMMSVLNC
jgi:hypothetical protein